MYKPHLPRGHAIGDIDLGTTLTEIDFESWADPCPPEEHSTTHVIKMKNCRENHLPVVRIASVCNFGEARFLCRNGETVREVFWKAENVTVRFKRKHRITTREARGTYDEVWNTLAIRDETQMNWPGHAAKIEEKSREALRYILPVK